MLRFASMTNMRGNLQLIARQWKFALLKLGETTLMVASRGIGFSLQFHLDGFRAGEPSVASASAAMANDAVDVLIVGCGPPV